MSPENPDMILNVHKPIGMTSYDVIRQVKRLIRRTKVGHGGTLDPFAEGVLLVLIGRATKRMSALLKHKKCYQATLKLGEATESGDNTAAVTQVAKVPLISSELLKRVEAQFTGEIKQIPPQYSAKKVNGKPAYKYARAGKTVELRPVTVNIYDLKLTKRADDLLNLHVCCSSGTYIRVLGEDIARALGTCGHLTALVRTAIGEYRLADSIKVKDLSQNLTELTAAGV